MVLTNGQWKRPKDIINAVLEAPVSVVGVSVDGGDKEGYEKSRLGGHFERLLENLTLLSTSKRTLRSHTMTYICLMLRPSERAVEKELMAFWSNYADIVMPQYLQVRRHLVYKEDVYMPVEFDSQSYPKCSLPFKALDVNWNGDVPLCSYSAQQIGAPGLILGNVMTDMLGDIWNGNVMSQRLSGNKAFIREDLMSYEGQG